MNGAAPSFPFMCLWPRACLTLCRRATQKRVIALALLMGHAFLRFHTLRPAHAFGI
jgi:hypothetical protein